MFITVIRVRVETKHYLVPILSKIRFNYQIMFLTFFKKI